MSSLLYSINRSNLFYTTFIYIETNAAWLTYDRYILLVRFTLDWCMLLSGLILEKYISK